MLLFKTEEEFRGQLEHSVEWNEEWIKGLQDGIKQQKEWLKRTSDADTIKSIRNSFKKTEDAIKTHRGFIAHAQEIYEERYGYRYGEKPKKRPAGKPKLTVIRGGKKADDGLSKEFLAFLKKGRSGDQHKTA